MSPSESDVSALVLTVGESTTDRAIESLGWQTLRAHEVIVVRDTRPFHRALNAGVAKVQTPFFVQVDADMILDPTCVASLRGEAGHDTGIVVGHLRDELIGDVVGVKLFRTRCFEATAFRDSISPDTDFGKDIAGAGWKTVYAGAPAGPDSEDWKTYGDHRPDYTLEYTYKKYLLEGRRYRYRDRIGGMRWHFGRLEASRHPLALVAQIALARGIFIDATEDLLGTLRIDGELEVMRAFFATSQSAPRDELHLPGEAAVSNVFSLCYRRGSELFLTTSFATFSHVINQLWTRRDDRAWIAKVALCQGLLAVPSKQKIQADWQTLRDFMHA